ncbi:MAG: ABC transporter permease [Ruminococcus sp.]|uniref:ABC transporter permease n=1 Tax=Schaedlerella arabinosiphila TaxID=2044587 RepID=A0A3R8KZ51_9FIRM|nr:ABC transporter permease subunit [Schaedlerella arabinosiphila]MCI8723176.1 ABC transporter permease [Ruminococcus sp.]RRK32920.1 ABC transporter permease [Schaedlerella arabinosiphila]
MNGSKTRQIKTLYVYELRKIVCRRIVWITGGIMLLLCVSLSFVDLISTSSDFGEGNEEIVVSGYEMMKIRRECARALSGRKIDDSLLQEMQDFSRGEGMKRESQDVDPATGIVVSVEPGETDAERGAGAEEETDAKEETDAEGDGDAKEEADVKTEPEDIWDRLWAAQKYTPIRIYVYRIMDYGDGKTMDAAGLYSEREKLIAQNREDQMLKQEEMEYWKKNDAGLELPFTYEYAEGWGELWNQSYVVNCMLLLLLLVSLSNVFSMEHQQKTDAVILCTRHGKRELYIAKVLAGITFGAAAALLLSGITLLSDLAVYGADGFGGALQIEFPLSSWRMSVGESVLVLFFMLLAISAMYSIVILFLSEWLKKGVSVMAILVGIMTFTLFIDIPFQLRTLSQVYDLLPTNLLIPWGLWDDRLFSVFGGYLTQFEAAPVMYALLSAVLLFLGRRIWQKQQVGV